MKVNGDIHAPATSPWEMTPLPTEQVAKWDVEEKRKISCPYLYLNPRPSSLQPSTILIVLFCLLLDMEEVLSKGPNQQDWNMVLCIRTRISLANSSARPSIPKITKFNWLLSEFNRHWLLWFHDDGLKTAYETALSYLRKTDYFSYIYCQKTPHLALTV